MSAASWELDRTSRRNAAATLLIARIVYAFNWYNVGAVLPLIGTHLGASTFQLGIVLGAFLAGAGLFQLPAGLAALRWGNRTVSLLALVLMGTFSLASAFAPSWWVLAILRFGAGGGAAFFFAPALGLMTSYFPAGSRGPVIGLFNSGFSIGSGAGLFAGALVGVAYGWPSALAIGGIALLGMAVIGPLTLPRSRIVRVHRPLVELLTAARQVLRSRSIWALSVGTSGLWAAYYVAAQYFVNFAYAAHPNWSLALAAAVPTVMIIFEIPGGPIGGWLGERSHQMRRVLLAWGVVAGLGIFLIPLLPLAGLVGLFAFLGFSDGVIFAVLYLIPSYLPESHGESLALGLAVVNSIQIFLGSALSVAFGYIAGEVGYGVAWAFAGAISLAPLPLLTWVSGRGGDSAGYVRTRGGRPRGVIPPHRPA